MFHRLSHFMAPLYVAPSTTPGNANETKASIHVLGGGVWRREEVEGWGDGLRSWD